MMCKNAPVAKLLSLFYLPAILVLNASSAQADALESLESYAEWTDVTNQPSVGSWTKVDSPNPVTNQGELVTAPAHGSVVPFDGDLLLDLRTNSFYESGGDGANYNYTLNVDDFGGVTPASHNSGTVDFSYMTCPDTWSGEGGNSFFPAGIYQTTSLLNGNGDVLAAIGMNSLGNQNSPEVHYSVDGVNWLSTGLQADSTTWTNVSISIDLDSKTTSFSYTDATSSTFSDSNLAWSSGITDTTVQALNLQMEDLVSKNYFDDFQFSPVASAVPEPSAVAFFALAGIFILGKRRRGCV